ncbi:MAG: hypothetical protein ACRCR3_01050, partial [Tannerellaceae bacterium]
MIEIFIIVLLIYVLVILPLVFNNKIWNYFFQRDITSPDEASRFVEEDIIVKSKAMNGQKYIQI